MTRTRRLSLDLLEQCKRHLMTLSITEGLDEAHAAFVVMSVQGRDACFIGHADISLSPACWSLLADVSPSCASAAEPHTT